MSSISSIPRAAQAAARAFRPSPQARPRAPAPPKTAIAGRRSLNRGTPAARRPWRRPATRGPRRRREPRQQAGVELQAGEHPVARPRQARRQPPLYGREPEGALPRPAPAGVDLVEKGDQPAAGGPCPPSFDGAHQAGRAAAPLIAVVGVVEEDGLGAVELARQPGRIAAGHAQPGLDSRQLRQTLVERGGVAAHPAVFRRLRRDLDEDHAAPPRCSRTAASASSWGGEAGPLAGLPAQAPAGARIAPLRLVPARRGERRAEQDQGAACRRRRRRASACWSCRPRRRPPPPGRRSRAARAAPGGSRPRGRRPPAPRPAPPRAARPAPGRPVRRQPRNSSAKYPGGQHFTSRPPPGPRISRRPAASAAQARSPASRSAGRQEELRPAAGRSVARGARRSAGPSAPRARPDRRGCGPAAPGWPPA